MLLHDDTTKYMVMSGEQNVGRSHNMRIDNRSFERLEELKYLGKMLTDQNCVTVGIKSILNSGNI
jgi:hypothetical protein